MKRETVLTILVLCLFAMNAAMLGFLLWTQTHHAPQQINVTIPDNAVAPEPNIVGALHLDSTQRRTFEQLKDEHRTHMVRLDTEYQHALQKYFDLLRDGRSAFERARNATAEARVAERRDSLEGILSKLQYQRAA